MDKNWWEIGEYDLIVVYNVFMGWLDEIGECQGVESWADDPAVWCEIFETNWGCTEDGGAGIAAFANDLRFTLDPQNWLCIADYLNHWDASDRQTEFKFFDWMCERYKKEHGKMPKHMREVRTASPDDKYALTWRQLMAEIAKLPMDELDMPAEVWVYSDTDFYDGGHAIYGISPYDSDAPIGPCNHSSIDIG